MFAGVYGECEGAWFGGGGVEREDGELRVQKFNPRPGFRAEASEAEKNVATLQPDQSLAEPQCRIVL